jgi:hypothetical protein
VAILSTAAVSGAHGAADRLSALTEGYQAAFAAAIAVAVLGMAAAGLLLGSRREPKVVAEAEPAAA